MRLLTVEAARGLDRILRQRHGLSESELIQRAGRAAAARALERFGPLQGRRVLVCCGKGHNAADGMVAASALAQSGAKAQLWLALGEDGLAPEAAAALAQARAQGVELLKLPSDGPSVARALQGCGLAIDALVGTGSRLPLTGALAAAAEGLAQAGVPVLALDLPSGLDADSGEAQGPCVQADLTVTFFAAKPGFFLGQGPAKAGSVVVESLGLSPDPALPGEASAFDEASARAALPKRSADTHKKRAAVLLVAGSSDYLGAALLCARGAYRAGAGMVHLALPFALAPAAMAAFPELVVHALPAEGALGLDQAGALLGLAAPVQAVVVGPGLGRRRETLALVRALWADLALPGVFDADALAALAPGAEHAGPRVLTPHEGELKRLMGERALDAGRPAAARALAKAYACTALLKGPATLVAGTDGGLSINTSGSPVLATAGTGDVLAGAIAGLLAQGAAPVAAAALGAWAHGLAAERWSAVHAGRGLLASELADGLPGALAQAGA